LNLSLSLSLPLSATFKEVGLNEDWCDYDEGADVSPEISDFECKIERYNPPKNKAKKGKKK
jgi:hypothetical protein